MGRAIDVSLLVDAVIGSDVGIKGRRPIVATHPGGYCIRHFDAPSRGPPRHAGHDSFGEQPRGFGRLRPRPGGRSRKAGRRRSGVDVGTKASWWHRNSQLAAQRSSCQARRGSTRCGALPRLSSPSQFTGCVGDHDPRPCPWPDARGAPTRVAALLPKLAPPSRPRTPPPPPPPPHPHTKPPPPFSSLAPATPPPTPHRPPHLL